MNDSVIYSTDFWTLVKNVSRAINKKYYFILILILKEGIVQAWITSNSAIINRIFAKKRKIKWISVLINWNKKFDEFI